MFDRLTSLLEASGILMRGGSIVDATLIDAPSSTKNATHSRDPEMSSTRKNNNYHFGCKAHIGVDAGTGMVHSFELTTAKVSDISQAHLLIRDDDDVIYADAGYTGLSTRKEIQACAHLCQVDYRIARRRSTVKDPFNKAIERRKAAIRSKVEHPFHVVKDTFGFKKCKTRGLAKTRSRLYTLFASANLSLCSLADRTLVQAVSPA